MDECDCPSADVPIRQGDIFIWGDWEIRDPWDQLGVILTADCDIAQQKFGNFLTYIPIIRLTDYIHDVWAVRKLEKLYEKHVLATVQQIHRHHKKINPDAKPLSQQSLEHWVSQKGAHAIVISLQIKNRTDAEEINALCDVVQLCLDALKTRSRDLILPALVAVSTASKGVSFEKAIEKIRTQLLSETLNSGHDVFFVGSIPNIEELGFMIMLRHVRPISIHALTTSFLEAKGSADKAARVARLRDVYKYALSQQFGTLYSRIGMPTAYEDAQKLIIEEICGHVSRKLGEEH